MGNQDGAHYRSVDPHRKGCRQKVAKADFTLGGSAANMAAPHCIGRPRDVIRIGPYLLRNRVALAPMAGVTDLPFRELAWQSGAGLVVAEMVSARPDLANTALARRRRAHGAEIAPRSVQIAGADPRMLADAARLNVDEGAQIIDINMGCPAKQVCQQAAGSALLRDEALVARILTAVVAAVAVPVTLKIRTGWDGSQRNGVTIARIAAACGVQALAVHGRTRACRFVGAVEYDTIAAIKAAVTMPIYANGDIDSAAKATAVLAYTGADGVMIGRGAQGRPWLLGQIAAALEGTPMAPPGAAAQVLCLRGHVQRLHEFYGAEAGLRIARKHAGWYFASAGVAGDWRRRFNALQAAAAQVRLLDELLDELLNELLDEVPDELPDGQITELGDERSHKRLAA